MRGSSRQWPAGLAAGSGILALFMVGVARASDGLAPEQEAPMIAQAVHGGNAATLSDQVVPAASPAAWWWSQGVEAFRAGVAAQRDAEQARRHFATAARAWEHVWSLGVQTPAVARNRARAWYLAGNLPAALAALLQGLEQTPWDYPLRQEWLTLRRQIALPADPAVQQACQPLWGAGLRGRLSPIEMGVGTTALWTMACLALLRYAMTRRYHWLIGAILLIVGIGSVSGYWLWEQQHARWQARHRPMLVLAEPTLLRLGNAEVFPPRWSTPLPAGIEARCLHCRGGWVHVQLADGSSGWVPQTSVIWIQTEAMAAEPSPEMSPAQ
ncbi:MAG: hypothetical protein RMJ88_08280 [Thermogemmata sp.]|nr:hypothetical protein [Thermogemmata sp.]